MDPEKIDCDPCASEEAEDVDSMPSECLVCYRKRCTGCMDEVEDPDP